MPVLPHDDILKLRAAVISAGLSKSSALLAGIDPSFVAGLPKGDAAGTQLLTNLDALNAAGALADGSMPLLQWLKNSVALAGPRQEAQVFARALEQVQASSTTASGNAGAALPASAPVRSAAPAQFNINISGSTIGSAGFGRGAKVHVNVGEAAGLGTASRSRPEPAGSPSARAIDFAILTAIEVERRAVCAAFGLTERDRVKKDGHVYWRGSLALPSGETYQLVVAQSRDMGQVEAALLATVVIKHWSPNAALLVGIAASTDKDVHLGDVVAGRSVYYYEHGKVTPGGTKPQPEMIDADPVLMNTLVALPDWDGAAPVARPDGSNDKPKVHQGVIASGEKVIADITERNRIASGHRKIIAIEMEGYGFSRAVWQSYERARHLDIRGICDDGTEKKDDRWHGYAAATAAAFARHFLLDRPLEPRNGISPPHP